MTQQAVTIPKEIAKQIKGLEEKVTLLTGFRDLVAERTGYMFGAKALSTTMSEKTEKERKVVREKGKNLKEAFTTLIEQPTKKHSENFLTVQKEVDEARKANKTAREPHMEKITPLRRAVRYLDVVAVPDALKELGVKTLPRFSLSDWVSKAIIKKKNA